MCLIIKDAKASKSAKESAKEAEATYQNAEGLFVRLKMCLHVQQKYKEAFRNLRDGLGGSQTLSSFPSVSSFQTSDQSSAKPESNRKTVSTLKRSQNDTKNHGILMSEEDVIFQHIDNFCARAKYVIEEMVTLAQFNVLAKTSIGLSRPKREDLGLDDNNGDVDFDVDNNLNESGELDDNDTDNDNDDDLNDAETYNEKKNNKFEDDSVIASAKNPNMDTVLEEDTDNFSREATPVIQQQSRSTKREKSKKTDNSNSDDEIPNNLNENLAITAEAEAEEKTNRLSNTNMNPYRNEEAENLFKTEKRVDEDGKRILKKAQTLSKEDLRLMS